MEQSWQLPDGHRTATACNCLLSQGINNTTRISLIHALVLHHAFEKSITPHLAYATIRDYYCSTRTRKNVKKLLIPLESILIKPRLKNERSVIQRELEKMVIQLVESEVRGNIGNKIRVEQALSLHNFGSK